MDHLCFLCVLGFSCSVHCCLVVICWERAVLLALVGDVYCIYYFPMWYPGQVWYLIVYVPDLCCLSYLNWLFAQSYYIQQLLTICYDCAVPVDKHK